MPLVHEALTGKDIRIVLPVFRALAFSWVAAKYPVGANQFTVPPPGDLSHFGVARAASRAAAATYGAVRGVIGSHSSTAAVFPFAVDAIKDESRTTATADGIGVFSTSTSIVAFWSAVSFDATRVEGGAKASDIARLPLWPQIQGQPGELQFLWHEVRSALLVAEQDWLVWITWYGDRLDGRVRDENRELAYVRIEEALWKQGPAVVNAEIRRLIEEVEPPPGVVPLHASGIAVAGSFAGPLDTPPDPIENVLSAVSFGWTSKGTITVVPGAQNWPVFPFHGGERDHANRLDACRVLATDTAQSLQSGRWNVRSEYAEIIDQYIACLPKLPGEGNFLLADAKARIVRGMFAAEQDFLPVPFAAELKVLLEQHIGLRAYYPATEDFYESVRSGHLERPLPVDAAEGFIQGVWDNTPILFEPNVADALQGVAKPLPQISKYRAGSAGNIPPHPIPPPDPLDPIDPEKSRRFTLASGINALWRVVSSGKKADESIEGWSEVIATLGPYVVPILEWLRSFVSGG